MIEPETFEFKGVRWFFVKERLFSDSKVYRSADGQKYLRIGEIGNIQSEAAYAKKLYGLSFPVPEMLEQGEINGHGYYIERSVGGTSFGDKFREECAIDGRVSSNSLEFFCDILCSFLRAQIKFSKLLDYQDDNLKKNIMLANVLQENTDIDANQLKRCVQKIESRLRTLPRSFYHGDLTPRNTYENGIIDLEFSSMAPIGYDVLTAPVMERFWGFRTNDKETSEEFDLQEGQVAYYLGRIEEEAALLGLKGLLKFFDDFILLKAVWSLAYEKQHAVQLGDTVKWNFRKGILVYCLKCYLIGEQIETGKFRMQSSFTSISASTNI